MLILYDPSLYSLRLGVGFLRLRKSLEIGHKEGEDSFPKCQDAFYASNSVYDANVFLLAESV